MAMNKVVAALIDEEKAEGSLAAGEPPMSPVSKPVEEAPASTQGFWLLVWMLNNIAVTMLNKAAFAKVDFQYPYALSTIHMACNIIGAHIYFMFARGQKPKTVEPASGRSILIFSVIFSLNIAIGNTSLQWVSVNFNQVARSLVPVLVMFISIVYFRRTYSSERKWAVVPIVVGVATAFYGDLRYTTMGIVWTALCVVLAALKAVVGGELLQGDLKLTEIDLLYKMCPLAFVQLGTIALLNGEVSAIADNWESLVLQSAPQVVLLTGLLSFSLNVSSFIANKVTSALTLCIAANVKQVLLVVFGTMYFGDPVSFANGLGIVIVILGSYRYGMVTIREKA